MTLLIVEAVSKRFGELAVTDDMSFSVTAGEALGIVGPNGAGKTTLLKLVAGDLRPDAGHIHFDGREVTKLAANARCNLGMGRTSQIPRPFEGLTVFENALVGSSFGAGNRLAGTREQAAADAVERVGMNRKANVIAGSLTLLERKRLELARALATQPRLLLLDEIAGGLTEEEVLELVELIKQIHSSGVAIVWIEHIVHALIRVVDRMIAIDAGSMLADGDPQTVMSSDAVRSVYIGAEV